MNVNNNLWVKPKTSVDENSSINDSQEVTLREGYRHVAQRMSISIVQQFDDRFQRYSDNNPVLLLSYTKRTYHALKGIFGLLDKNDSNYENLAEYFAYGYLGVAVFTGDPVVLNAVGCDDIAELKKRINDTFQQIESNDDSDDDDGSSNIDQACNENVSAASNLRCNENVSAASNLRLPGAWKIKDPFPQIDGKVINGLNKSVQSTTASRGVGNTSTFSSQDYIPSLTAPDGWKTPYPNDFFRFFIHVIYDAKTSCDTSLYIPVVVYSTVDSTYLSVMQKRPEENIQGALKEALQIGPFQASNVADWRHSIFAYIENYEVGDIVLYRKQTRSQDWAFMRGEAVKAQITRICRNEMLETGGIQLRVYISRLGSSRSRT